MCELVRVYGFDVPLNVGFSVLFHPNRRQENTITHARGGGGARERGGERASQVTQRVVLSGLIFRGLPLKQQCKMN